MSSSGSIYGLLKKDQLISAIKANPLGNTTAKIAAITALNMEDLETTLKNKRAIERRFDYNITQQIVTTNSFTVTQLKDMFVSFPIESSQNIAKDLAQEKQKLQVNSGSSIVT